MLFGHLGDTKGRGFCLLLSVLVMGIPTVLIGCLPTFTQAGIASPIMLAVLRLIQGIWQGRGGVLAAAALLASFVSWGRLAAVHCTDCIVDAALADICGVQGWQWEESLG